MLKLPKLRRPSFLQRIPHRLVSCAHRGGCEYELVWDDGYKTIYSAAVQLGYRTAADDLKVSLSDDGTRVLFPDGTSMSAELMRVDSMQKLYRSTSVVLLFSAGLLVALYWLLYSGAFTSNYITAMYACIGMLCAMTALPMYRTRCYAINYIGAALTFVGVTLSPTTYAGIVLVALGFVVQFLYLFVMMRLTSSGYDS